MNNIEWNLGYNTFRVHGAAQLTKPLHIFNHLILIITLWKRQGKYYLQYIKEKMKMGR